jgi:hypothetical protein
MGDHPTLTTDPQELDHTGTFDDLLAEVAMTYPLARSAAGGGPDAEDACDHQLLAGLVLP